MGRLPVRDRRHERSLLPSNSAPNKSPENPSESNDSDPEKTAGWLQSNGATLTNHWRG
jgi:hypothetical protein